ncbi:hypothetical protein ANN_18282 [Periplaneta americana]|uniref:Uncharacterized protein n=1 Tax=Periplaneta americana TaxID=6978 RepID=A0ABQ8SPJ7_PERAM|nr:hypothetical protein ANN_18282 [Periplaneta americana]
MGESRNAYRLFVWRPEENRWEDNIKMDLREFGCDAKDYINIAQDRDRWRAYVRAAMNLRVLLKPFVSDNAGEMSPGSSTESCPAFAHHGLRENPGKNLNQVTCPDLESNPGHLVSQPDALTVTPQGHGKFGEYLARFKLQTEGKCKCDEETQTVRHILFECPLFRRQRHKLKSNLDFRGYKFSSPLQSPFYDEVSFKDFLIRQRHPMQFDGVKLDSQFLLRYEHKQTQVRWKGAQGSRMWHDNEGTLLSSPKRLMLIV